MDDHSRKKKWREVLYIMYISYPTKNKQATNNKYNICSHLFTHVLNLTKNLREKNKGRKPIHRSHVTKSFRDSHFMDASAYQLCRPQPGDIRSQSEILHLPKGYTKGKSTWHRSHVLVYISPIQFPTFWSLCHGFLPSGKFSSKSPPPNHPCQAPCSTTSVALMVGSGATSPDYGI